MADAAIACWEAKYSYSAWRPVTANPTEASIGNAGITVNAGMQRGCHCSRHLLIPNIVGSLNGQRRGCCCAREFLRGRQTFHRWTMICLIGVTRSTIVFTQALTKLRRSHLRGTTSGLRATTAGNRRQSRALRARTRTATSQLTFANIRMLKTEERPFGRSSY